MVTALGVFLIALGAVLAFAVGAAVPGVDLLLVGGLLMLLGATGAAISMMRWTPRRRARVTPYRPVVRRTVHL